MLTNFTTYNGLISCFTSSYTAVLTHHDSLHGLI